MHCGSLLLLGGVHDLDFDFKSSKGKLGDDEDDGGVGCDDDDEDNDVHLDGEAGVDLLELAFARILDVEFDLLPS